MQEFLLLIAILLFIAFVQKGAEILLEKNNLEKHKPMLSIGCIITSYLVLGRYVYVHILEDLIAFIGFSF
ncbi:MAG: hypothetical protein FWC73_06430 [Defluviitaleaceae bacterium]|nr:hypothetical protein [Defluviitaleaceae bacterium]